jgi:hypothetical protein
MKTNTLLPYFILVIGLLILFTFPQCSFTVHSNKTDIVKLIHQKDIECKGIPFGASQIKVSGNSTLTKNQFVYYDNIKDQIGIYDLNKNTIKEIKIPTDGWINYRRKSGKSFFFNSPDSIYYFNNRTNKISIFNIENSLISRITLDSNYSVCSLTNHYFIVNEDIYYTRTSDINIKTKFDRIETLKYAYPVNIMSRLVSKNETTYNSFGDYPKSYKEGNNYYNFLPDLFVGLKGETILSYESDHSLFIYDKDLHLKIVECKSKQVDSFISISDKDFLDHTLAKKFLGEKARYINLITDPVNKRYYRIMKPETKSIEIQDGMAHWALIVMDENFTTLFETQIPFNKCLPDIFIPTSEGFLVKKMPQSEKEFKGDLILSEYKIL